MSEQLKKAIAEAFRHSPELERKAQLRAQGIYTEYEIENPMLGSAVLKRVEAGCPAEGDFYPHRRAVFNGAEWICFT